METRIGKETYRRDRIYEPINHNWHFRSIHRILKFILSTYAIFGLLKTPSAQQEAEMVRIKEADVNEHFHLRNRGHPKLESLGSSSGWTWITYWIIKVNFYVAIKFLIISIVLLCFNYVRDSIHPVSIDELQCVNITSIFRIYYEVDSTYWDLVKLYYGQEQLSSLQLPVLTVAQLLDMKNHSTDHSTLIEFHEQHPFKPVYDPIIKMAQLIHYMPCPWFILGNVTTLIYFCCAIGIGILCVLLPIELLHRPQPFNTVRFCFGHRGLSNDSNHVRAKHLDRLDSKQELRDSTGSDVWNFPHSDSQPHKGWSLGTHSNRISNAISMRANRRSLRSEAIKEADFQIDSESATQYYLMLNRCQQSKDGLKRRYTHAERNIMDSSKEKPIFYFKTEHTDHVVSIKSPRQILSKRHDGQKPFAVKIANENLHQFVPYTRGEAWFKLSSYLMTGATLWCFAVSVAVAAYLVRFLCKGPIDMDMYCGTTRSWTYSEWMSLGELCWAGLIISVGCSFYISNLLITVVEFVIRVAELNQQLNLACITLDLTNKISLGLTYFKLKTDHNARNNRKDDNMTITNYLKELGSYRRAESDNFRGPFEMRGRLASLVRPPEDPLHPSGEMNVDEIGFQWDETVGFYNHFGGIASLAAHWRLTGDFSSQRSRMISQDLAAMKLSRFKNTLMRAAYLNYNLIMDEMHDSRWVMTIVVERSSIFCALAACFIGLTRLNLQVGLIRQTIFLGLCLADLSMFMFGAAMINARIMATKSHVHKLLAHLSMSNQREPERAIVEYWTRHIHNMTDKHHPGLFTFFGPPLNYSLIMEFIATLLTIYTLLVV